MAQGEHVKEIRKALGLTLEKFGEKLGVGKTAISKIEKNERSLTDQMAKSICREYSVNYEYLMSGKGRMFCEIPQTALDELCKQYEFDSLDRSLIQSYLNLDANERRAIKKYVAGILDLESASNRAPTETKLEAAPAARKEKTVDELEEEYKKTISDSAQNTNFAASNTTDGKESKKAIG